MSKTDAYGYTYDQKIGRCAYHLNGRVVLPYLSGHSPVMRETPHLVHGEEITTGGISFDYLNTDPRNGLESLESVSDEDWSSAEEFKRAVRGAHECLMSHYDEDDDDAHMVMKNDPVYEVRTIWEGQLVASIDCTSGQDAWNTFRESTSDDDGYTIQLIMDDQILAEQTNPDENGEV